MSVVQALLNAQLELSFLHGCLATDRPDIPVTAETSWRVDHTKVLKREGLEERTEGKRGSQQA